VAVLVDIAEAVTEALQGGTFSLPFVPQRLYRPDFELAEMKDLHVSVVPRGLEMSAADRALTQDDVRIDVAVQKKLSADSADDSAELDALIALVEEIADFLRGKRQLAGAPNVAWVRTENEPVYSAEHLGELRQFTSVLTVTYRVMR
jgi:hypothetical protein